MRIRRIISHSMANRSILSDLNQESSLIITITSTSTRMFNEVQRIMMVMMINLHNSFALMEQIR
jgi:hypothetical protein